MGAAENAYRPDYAVHPGEYLEEVLASRRIGKKEFAGRCGLSAKTVSQIVNGKVAFSPEVALQFEKVLGIAAEIWLGMLSSWQLFQSRREDERRLEEAREWAKRFPLADMRRLGLLPRTVDWAATIQTLLAFFKVSSPDSWEDFYAHRAVAYRKSATLIASEYSVTTWLRIAEVIASDRETLPYSRDRVKRAMAAIRRLTIQTPDVFESRLAAECSESGIALVFVPELTKTRISGATEWLSSDHAMIAMSLRHKTNDHFWFTLFHEIGHIYLHEKRNVFIDSDSNNQTDREAEANDFARKALVPEAAYGEFVKRQKFYEDDIVGFAADVGIAPGIVVGMLQHDGLIKYSWHNNLKVRFKLVGAGTGARQRDSM